MNILIFRKNKKVRKYQIFTRTWKWVTWKHLIFSWLDSFKLYSDYESTWKYCRWLWVERFLNHWLVVTW